MEFGSKEVARAAITMSMAHDREEERAFKESFSRKGIHCAAVDFGGEFGNAPIKVVERAVVASKREGVIGETHAEEGAVAGATHEAISQLVTKAFGLNIGGKIGIARFQDHIAVSAFFGIGLLHLNEVAIGLGHRAI